ncbi:fimbrial protein [Paraburkholderia sp.]|uniref:fimbrial protein n=1 Tax=Paraburkholderia sp. TaxID=1926495 RepID=UPI0023A217B4|nr:fimbrial protein [Paraburkholderia sp.]MDE1180338.1 fimbrial protein [Paraburkholderia sp.]
MKSLFPSIAVVGLMSLASVAAHASDGTITITGTVSDSTCSINGIASGDHSDKTVVLPTVTAGSLASAGAVAGKSGPSDIVFSLSGCTGSATKAVARFENGPTVDQGSGYLNNQAETGGAKNVQVSLLNASMRPINIATGENNDLASNGATITGGAAEVKYFAQYYATGKAEAGAVETWAQYSMQYQ